MKSIAYFFIGLLAQSGTLLAQTQTDVPGETLLLRQPSLSKTHVAFSYGGDLWVANRDGSSPRRLTVGPGAESGPQFSPDGQTIAFTATYDGNTDVYLVGLNGGMPKRLTFHPSPETVKGWSADGQRVLFLSNSLSAPSRSTRAFTVSVKGELPQPLPIPTVGTWAKLSPDGKELAYSVTSDAFNTWKHYRGGMTTPIRLLNLQTLDADDIPHVNASDVQPVYVGNTIYFLSDRQRTMNVFAYDRTSKQVRQVTNHADFDVKSLATDGQTLVYEQAGRLHLLDPAASSAVGKGKPVPISLGGNIDVLALRPTWKPVGSMVRAFHLSPTGARAVVEARGDIYTLPAKKGDWRNLTLTDGVHERNPIWSPDGARIAYVSDASGEYMLALRDAKGEKPAEMVSLGDPSFYLLDKWSPDGKKLLYHDKKLNLWYMDLTTGRKPVKITTDTFGPNSTIVADWSPDSKWVAFSRKMDNYLNQIHLYELASGKTTPVTDGASHTDALAFSRDGKYLIFTASTNVGPSFAWLDMAGLDRRGLVTQNLYAVVLNAKDASPFAPESDDEKEAAVPALPATDSTRATSTKKAAPVITKSAATTLVIPNVPRTVIDLENIGQRIVALPVPAGSIDKLKSADGGRLFYIGYTPATAKPTLYRFDFKERKTEALLAEVSEYEVSADGKKLLFMTGSDKLNIADASGKPAVAEGKVDVSTLQAMIDPRHEWAQMLAEFWRIERDYFYVPNYHGIDWNAIKTKYAPFLPHVAHRADLNYLIGEMMGEMVVGHNYVSGGDIPDSKPVPVGMLGADYELAGGLYRFRKVFNGENWNPTLRAPLTEPGVNVKAGEYLLAINGKPLTASDNVYQQLENTVDRQITLTVGPNASMTGSRKVTVVPIAAETNLRLMDWVEGNRRKVHAATGGKVAYVYLPNTGQQGYDNFNRYYFSQVDKQAVIVDERFNGGGLVADYIVDMLDRPLLSYWAPRDGKPFTSPAASIYGPKVMIVNEYAGSGGDALPAFFRRRNLGTIVGKRTWGGLVGISGYPPLIDGGSVTSPSFGIYNPEGKWEIENEGVAPDIEVDMTPKLSQNGADPQLEKAIDVVQEQLKKSPVLLRPMPKGDQRAVGE
ncbi:PDZ domain-containing protein [uncultured Fibrella sp.]|uniref:S41 family peptidase n=1 Tax=uncultured Fibrella sp. TaxID=1284596 RepID=UPI0035CC7C6B